MKKWKATLIGFTKWSLVFAYLAVALAFVDSRTNQVVCSSIDIQISDSLINSFVTKDDVMQTIEKQYSNLIGIPMHMINTYDIEQQLSQMQGAKFVDAYKTIEGKLTVNIEQRKPIMRVINRYGQSYYIDIEGQILPLSSKFTSHVLIVNGNIVEPFEIESNVSLASWDENINERSPLIVMLFDLARFISNDNFWSSQISQVYVDNASNIELIPRVGPHTILLGSIKEYKTKLKKLKLFYEQALPEEGWNKYQQINLKFENQIVCTKR